MSAFHRQAAGGLLAATIGLCGAGCGGACAPDAAPSVIVFAARPVGGIPGPGSTRLVSARLDEVGGVLDMPDTTGTVTYAPSPSGRNVLVLRDPTGTPPGSHWVIGSDGTNPRELLAAGVALATSQVQWHGGQEAVSFVEGGVEAIPPSSTLFRWFSMKHVDTGIVTRLKAVEDQYDLVDLRTAPDGTFALLRYFRTIGPPDNARFDLFDILTGTTLAESTLSGDIDVGDTTPRWANDSTTYYHVRLDFTRPRRDIMISREFAAPGSVIHSEGPDAQILELVTRASASGPTRCAYVRRRLLTAPPPGGSPSVDELVVSDLGGGGPGNAFPLEGAAVVNEILFEPTGLRVWVDLDLTPDGGGSSVRTIQVFDAQTAARLLVLNSFFDHLDFDRVTGVVALQIPVDGQDPLLSQAGIWTFDLATLRPRRLALPGWIPEGHPRFLRSLRFAPGMAGDGMLR